MRVSVPAERLFVKKISFSLIIVALVIAAAAARPYATPGP
jgi:hypothetical protein